MGRQCFLCYEVPFPVECLKLETFQKGSSEQDVVAKNLPGLRSVIVTKFVIERKKLLVGFKSFNDTFYGLKLILLDQVRILINLKVITR